MKQKPNNKSAAPKRVEPTILSSSLLVEKFTEGFVKLFESCAADCATKEEKCVFSISGDRIRRFVLKCGNQSVNGYSGKFSFSVLYEEEHFFIERASFLRNDNDLTVFDTAKRPMEVIGGSELHKNLYACMTKLIPKKKKREFVKMCEALADTLSKANPNA